MVSEDTASVLRAVYRALDVMAGKAPPPTQAESLILDLTPRVLKGRDWIHDQIALDRAYGTYYLKAQAELRAIDFRLKEARKVCPHGRATLVRKPTADDQQQACIWCPTCGQNALGNGRWIKHDLLVRAGVSNVKALALHPEAGLDAVPLCCSRCRRQVPVQLHLWAPRGRFGDADEWPTDYLCADCHKLWHDVMGWGNEQAWSTGRGEAS